jgi:hypothetical protein
MVKCGRCNSRKKSRSRLRRKSRRMRGGACTHSWNKQSEKAREKDGADYNYKCSKCKEYCDESERKLCNASS